MINKHQSELIELLNDLSAEINENAILKGFWMDQNPGNKIALMHSELSEALEAERDGNPPDKHCPEFSSMEVEFADVIIRILDFGKQRGLDIPKAILAKMDFNKSRPYMHGRK